jgi:Major Facilitator Superfamily
MSETMSMTSAGNSLDSPELAGFRRHVAALSAMGVFLDGFGLTVIAAVGLLIQERFRYSGNTVGLVDASAFIGMVIGSLAIGWMTDRIGRRKMYFVDLVGFVVFAALTAAAQSTWQLVAARILLGRRALGRLCAHANGGTQTLQGRGAEDRQRSDKADSQPNPAAIDMRWKMPPFRRRRGTRSPNAAPNSKKLPAMLRLETAE